MAHKRVIAADLKVGDVICPYGDVHLHFPVLEIMPFDISILYSFGSPKPTFGSIRALAELDIVVEG